MRTRLIGGLLVAAMALTACGGDDDGGGGGGGSPQDQVADLMLDELRGTMEQEGLEGVEIDEECVRDAVAKLSDDDAQAIVDAGPDGDPDISVDATEFAASMTSCIDLGAGG